MVTAALIAGGLALGMGAIDAISGSRAASKSKSAAKAAEAETREWAQGIKDKTAQHYAETEGLYGSEEDVQKYLDKARGMDMEALYNEFYDLDGDGKADVDSFSFDKSAEDYVNANREKILGDVMKKAQGVAAGAGMGRSYDGLAKMISDAEDKDEQLWNDANSQYNQARSQAYQEWNSFLQQKNNQYNAIVNAMNGDLSAMKGIADMFQQHEEDEFSDLMNAEIAGHNAVQNAQNTTMNTGNYTTNFGGIFSNAFGAAAPFFKE